MRTHTHTRTQKDPEARDLPSEVTGDFPDNHNPEEGVDGLGRGGMERRGGRQKNKKDRLRISFYQTAHNLGSHRTISA